MLTQQTSNPTLWNQVWSQSSQDKSDFWEWVERESNGVRGRKIQNYLRIHVGNMNEILKAYLQRKNKWELGYEDAFSRKEFFKLARQLQLSNSKLIGSAFLSDFHRYIQIYRSTHIFQKIFGSNSSTSAKSQIQENQVG